MGTGVTLAPQQHRTLHTEYCKNRPPVNRIIRRISFPFGGFSFSLNIKKEKERKEKITSKSQSFAIVNADAIEITVLHNF